MKNEASIRKWASLIMKQEVKSLAQVKEISFIQTFLFQIDQIYFQRYQPASTSRKNSYDQQSYSEILLLISKYFKEEIGTNIKHYIDNINVFKDILPVWELLLGMAIKGNNRNHNINVIFEMDGSLQSELMGFVSEIIEKFGQTVSNEKQSYSQLQQPEEEIPQKGNNELLMDLIEEHELLKEKYQELKIDYEKEKKNILLLKNQFEDTIEMLKLEKMVFIEVLANANSNDLGSKIFQADSDSIFNAQSSLPEIAKDLLNFLNDQKKYLRKINEKNMILEEESRDYKKMLRKVSDENDGYRIQVADVGKYEKEVEELRHEINQNAHRQNQLYDKIAEVEQQKLYLVEIISRKKNIVDKEGSENEDSRLGESNDPKQQRKTRKIGSDGLQEKTSKHYLNYANQSPSRNSQASSSQNEEDTATNKLKRQIDEIREPSIRNKLQREISHLQKIVAQLKQQNQALKKANQILQKSTLHFVQENQSVALKWEHDYDDVIEKMKKMMQKEEDLQLQINQAKAQQKPEERKSELADQVASKDEVKNEEERKGEPENQDERSLLWREIIFRVKEIMQDHKNKEISYEKTINQLQLQNTDLLQRLRENIPKNHLSSPPQLSNNSPEICMSEKSEQHQKFSLVKQESLTFSEFEKKGQPSNQFTVHITEPMALKRQSYVELQEGDDINEDEIVDLKKNFIKSSFYQMNSMILNELNEKGNQPQPRESIFESKYMQVNRKLDYSILSNINHLETVIENDLASKDLKTSTELKVKLEGQINQIKQQYTKINNSYEVIFNKLNIYTSNLSSKAQRGEYQHILQEIKNMEKEIKGSDQQELVKLKVVNNNLKAYIKDTVIWKEQVIAAVHALETKMKTNQSNAKSENSQTQMVLLNQMLKEIKQKYCQQFEQPLQYLNTFIQQNAESPAYKVFKMYEKEKDRNRCLHQEIEVMANVLIQYRNMVCQE